MIYTHTFVLNLTEKRSFTELFTRFDNEKDNNHQWRTAKEHEHRQVVAEFCRRRQIGGW